MRRPSPSPVTLAFNASTPPYSDANRHKGTDFAYLPDNKVYAPFTGIAIVKPLNGPDGNAVYMYDPQGRFHGLLHLSQFFVASGVNVPEGQVIGIMGATGNAQGVHLHWCVKENGVFIDPLTLVKEISMILNEGDRKNFNVYLYGKDKGKFKGAVGREFKDGIYAGMFETEEFKIDQLVNSGDVASINSTFGRTDGDTMLGKTWKEFYYEYTTKNLPTSDFVPVDQLYVKKKA